MVRTITKDLQFFAAFQRLLSKFGIITANFLLLFFLTLGVLQSSQKTAQVIDVQSGLVFLFSFVFATFLMSLIYARDKVKKYFDQLKKHNGIKALATQFISFTLLLFIFSGANKVVNADIVSGIFANTYVLIVYYTIVSFAETLIFAIFLRILIEKWSGNEGLPADVYTSILFAGYHVFAYNFALAPLLFAFVANMIFIWLVKMQSVKIFGAEIPTLPFVISLHAVFNTVVTGVAFALTGGISLI